MSFVDVTHVTLTVVFALVAVHSAARLVLAARRGNQGAATAGALMPDAAHALIAGTLAFLLAPGDRPTPTAFAIGLLVFGVLGWHFAAALRRDGAASRAGADGRGAHGGYNMHHVACSVAMMYLCVAAPVVGCAPDVACAASPFGSTMPEVAAGIAGINGVLGLYFLVAATSLGFRVAEPRVRIVHRVAIPVGVMTPQTPATQRPAAGLLTSRAGRCAGEVATSAGLALVFLT